MQKLSPFPRSLRTLHLNAPGVNFQFMNCAIENHFSTSKKSSKCTTATRASERGRKQKQNHEVQLLRVREKHMKSTF